MDMTLETNNISAVYHYIAQNRKQTTCTLHADYLRCEITDRKGNTEIFNMPYRDIVRIHLGWLGKNMCHITIYDENKRKIRLQSLTFFIVESTRIRRFKNTSKADIDILQGNMRKYSIFIQVLHQKLEARPSIPDRKYRYGNNMHKILLWIAILLIFGLFVPMLYGIGAYGKLFFFVLAGLCFVLFSFKLDAVKAYSPDQIPQKYLPVVT